MDSHILNNTPWRVANLSFTDADSPKLIDLRYLGDEEASVTLDANGGSSSSKFKLTLTTGSNTYVITPDSSDTNDTEATTINALLNAINDIGEVNNGDHEGWEARRRNCLGEQSINSDDFIDISATRVSNNWTSFIQQDMSEVSGALASGLGLTAYRFVNYGLGARRNSLSNQWDVPKGMIDIGRLDFHVTFSSTAPHVYVLQDDGTIIHDMGALTTATQADSDEQGFTLEHPLTVRGPVLVGLHCPAALDSIVHARINWRNHNI